MKKALSLGFVAMAILTLGAYLAFAGGKECTADKAADSKSCSATSAKAAGCCASKASTASATSTNATMATSKTTGTGAVCSPSDKAACLAKSSTCTAAEKAACQAKASTISTASATDPHKASCSPETIGNCVIEAGVKHSALCGADAAKHYLTSMSIKGMTCAGCESSVRTALMAVEGVKNVVEVCYKAGFAVVCTENPNFNNESLIKAVSSKGYESQIIPAVAVTTSDASKTEKPACPAHPSTEGSK